MAFNEIVNLTSQLSNIETFLNNKNAALVSPKTSPGIAGFVFDIPQQERIVLEADITDNFTENNSFIQDHRVIKPVKITLTGLIGELVIKKDIVDLIFATIQSSLTTVNAYLGNYTAGVGQILQNIFSVTVSATSRTTQIVNRIKNIVEGFDGEGQYRNLQQRAFSNLQALFLSKTVLTVQTPWNYYDSMMIERFEFSQDEETELLSSISVTLKEIRFAEVGITSFQDNIEANRNDMQEKGTNDTGQIKGVRNSFLFDGITAIAGGF